MLALIIISIILLILAMVNWGQSKGFFYKLVRKIRNLPLEDEQSQQPSVVGASGTSITSKEDFEDNAYANDDDQDYLDSNNVDRK